MTMYNPLPLEKQDPDRKSNLLRWLAGTVLGLVVAAVAGIYGWRYVYNPCEVDIVQESSTFLETQLKSYDHLYQVATGATPATVDAPLQVMQQIFMDTQATGVPACMQSAKNNLLHYMETVIRAFRAWEVGESNSTIGRLLSESDIYYENFREELDTINECAPFCIR